MPQNRLLPKRRAALLLATLPFALFAQPGAAQSYAVVQATPSPAQGDLSRALQRLARNPGDFDALVEAARASLALDDIDAAIGFFGRADVLRQGDPRVKAGLATANLKSGRPIEALALFDQAAAAGALPGTIAADRGLAYDLVGNNTAAQAQYRLALSAGTNDEIARRLGLSEAISGDEKAFEAALLPLLQRRDLAAYRARAFGLAILGKQDEAVAIAEAVMPRDLAARMTPYLQYMPRLTRAQQAAAANLGSFPRAAQIGRDDPRFAQYAGPQTAAPVRTADARLAPTGQPLGPATTSPRIARRQSAAERRRAEAEAEAARANAPQRSAPMTVAQAPRPASVRPTRRAGMRMPAPPPPPPPAQSARVTVPVPAPAEIVLPATPATNASPASARTAELEPVRVMTTPVPPPSSRPPASPPPPPPSADLRAAPIVVAEMPASSAAAIPAPAPGSVPAPGSAPATSAPRGGAAPPPVVIVPVPREAERAAPVSQPAVAIAPAVPQPASVADAFADLLGASTAIAPAAGAVDITRIKPKLELPDPPKASPPPPPPPPPPPAKAKVPSRIWVQVATGKDPKALAFDWRKFGKEAPALLGKRSAYTAAWGQTRRLVTGPLDSAKAANQLVADLKKAGIDAFVFTSAEGEDVAPIK